MKKITVLLSMLVLCMAFNWIFPVNVQAENDKQGNLLTDKENDLTLQVNYGYDNTVKYGRYTEVTGIIQNNGKKEFTGTFQCLIPKSKDNTIYKESFHVKAGESKTVSLVMPIIDDTGFLQVKLLNRNQKEVLEHKFQLTFGNYDKSVYAGVLTDNQEELDYLGNLNLRPIYLSADTLTDNFLGLDLLDVLIINNFDTAKLKKEQIEAIKEWVYLGGTLVLTAGNYDAGTKAAFGEDFGISVGEREESENISFLTEGSDLKILKQYIYDYQKAKKNFYQELSEKDQKILSSGNITSFTSNTGKVYGSYTAKEWSDEEIEALKTEAITKKVSDITLENGISLVKENQKELMLCAKEGNGKVELIAFDIGLKKEQKAIALSFIRQIADNISEGKKNQLNNEYYGWYLSDGLLGNIASKEAKKMPATYKYVIIIVAYLLASGPITYLWLKRKKKQGYGLLTVTVLSALFTIIIILAGMDTRITRPYAEYLRIKDYTRTGMDRVDLSLTMPSNYDYTLNLTKSFPLVEMSDANPYTKDIAAAHSYTNYNNSNKAIEYGSSAVTLQVRDNTAFSPVYFQGNFKTEKQAGSFTGHLSHTGNGISGTILNGFNFDITHAILLCDEHLIDIGDIKSGQLITLNNDKSGYMNSIDDLFDNNLMKELTGLPDSGKDRNENARLNQLIVTMIENNYSQGVFSDCIIGFQKTDTFPESGKGLGDEFLSQVASLMQTKGIEMVKIPVEVDNKLGSEEFVYSIDPYIQLEGSNMGTYYTSRYMANDSVLLTYQFPAGEKVKDFTVLKNQNLKSNNKYVQNFNGTVYFLNVNTGKYEEVFTDNYDTKIDASNYLTENNTLTVRYRQDSAIQNYQVVLPHISYWKEAN